MYGHLPSITKTIQVSRTRHAGHSWRSKDELVSDLLLRNPLYGRPKVRRPARTYIQLLCVDTGYSPKDLPGAMNYGDGWRKRVTEICYWQRDIMMMVMIYIYIYIYIYYESVGRHPFIILFYFIAYIPHMRSIVYNSYAISHLVIIIIIIIIIIIQSPTPYILHQRIYDTI